MLEYDIEKKIAPLAGLISAFLRVSDFPVFTAETWILICKKKVYFFITGDPRCTEIILENSGLNSCEVKVASVPHFCALTDPANLLKW